MSKDLSCSIAKVSYGHGYYLREALAEKQVPQEPNPPKPAEQVSAGRDSQAEEKFRSIVMRYSEQTDSSFPIHIEHTRAMKSEAGMHKWKFPDLVLLKWTVGKLTDDGYRLDKDLLSVRASLGDPLFSLESIELKVALSVSDFRENFFQCVSNSKWAHRSTLAIAGTINDQKVRDELERLGASYDIAITSYGLSEEKLASLPSAQVIKEMNDGDFEEIASQIKYIQISTGKDRSLLDWEHINDLRTLSPDFIALFEWIAYCLAEKRASTFTNYQGIKKLLMNG
jgi:hypothetical protein